MLEDATNPVIVVIHWKINRGSEGEFFKYWSRELPLAQDSAAVGEFLSRPMSAGEVGYQCTELGHEPDASYVSFFNVGFWPEQDAFYREVILPYVTRSPEQKKFEKEPRERMILRPQLWRMRTGSLPSDDRLL